jgi:anti-sigma B factor antagonist
MYAGSRLEARTDRHTSSACAETYAFPMPAGSRPWIAPSPARDLVRMKAGELGIGVVRDDDRYTLLLTGELDLASAPALEQILTELCTDGASGIVLDLSRLAFIDSTGLRTILTGMAICERHICGFWLIPGTSAVQRVFQLTGLGDKLPFCEPGESPALDQSTSLATQSLRAE